MPEEPLFGALERRHCRRLGVPVPGGLPVDDAGGLKRRPDVPVDYFERPGVRVVDAPLRIGQRMLQDVDLDAVIGERPGLIEPERLEIARDHLQRGDPAGLHGGDEVCAGLERRLSGGPQPQPLGVGESRHGGGAGGRDIDDAGVGQRALEPQSRAALLRRRDLAAGAPGTGGVGHRVRLVEHDHPVEGVAVILVERTGEPAHDLLQPRDPALTGRRAQGRVGGEQNAFGQRDVRALAELAQGYDVGLPSAERGPVAARVLESLSDCESHRARFRPRSQRSSMTAAICRPLPAPVPSPSIQPRRKRTGAERVSPSPAADSGPFSSPPLSQRCTVSQPAPIR